MFLLLRIDNFKPFCTATHQNEIFLLQSSPLSTYHRLTEASMEIYMEILNSLLTADGSIYYTRSNLENILVDFRNPTTKSQRLHFDDKLVD